MMASRDTTRIEPALPGRKRVSARDIALWAAFLAVGTATQIAFKIASAPLEKLDVGWDWVVTAASTPALAVAIVAYLATFGLWIVILARTALSRAFLLTALIYVAVTLVSALWLGERIEPIQYAGILLVIAGIALLGAAGQTPRQDS